jgi:hypothetical protein
MAGRRVGGSRTRWQGGGCVRVVLNGREEGGLEQNYSRWRRRRVAGSRTRLLREGLVGV